MVTLLISDVPGDAPEVIASGPTVPDSTTCADALAILNRYGIDPAGRARRAGSGAFESPNPGDPRFAGHQVHMIATPRQSLEAAAAVARRRHHAHILSDEIEGEIARGRQGACRAGAFGGACRHAVREALRHPQRRRDHGDGEVQGRPRRPRHRVPARLRDRAAGPAGVHVLAADTDGIDGVEDNASAIVTPDTLARARRWA